MNEQQFWQLIDNTKGRAGDDPDARPALLQKQLMELGLDSIQRFQRAYEDRLLEANLWSVLGAACLMNGGCSDDSFKYFRDWLISEGEQTFRSALADPDTLVSIPRRDYFELELFGYAALYAFAEKGGGELDRDFEVEDAVTDGDEWDESDLPKLFPRLASKYL